MILSIRVKYHIKIIDFVLIKNGLAYLFLATFRYLITGKEEMVMEANSFLRGVSVT